jgi:nucleoside-diphosphate-sugar epimerase
MRVFVTGATGFIGTALTRELLDAGHKVLGLTRSEDGAKALAKAGAEVHRGNIDDLDSIRTGAAGADAVAHLAFNHDFSDFAKVCDTDRRVIETIGTALAGSDRLMVITSGTAMAARTPGKAATEDGPVLSSKQMPRAISEETANSFKDRGVRVAIVRLPQVHDTRKAGLITYAVQIARQKGVVAYVGEGKNRWAAGHLSDTARLYRLALEKKASAVYHAVGEEGVASKDIAEAVAQGMKLPTRSVTQEEALAEMGFLGHFASWDMPASSALTQKALGWTPTGTDLLTDLRNTDYSQPEK